MAMNIFAQFEKTFGNHPSRSLIARGWRKRRHILRRQCTIHNITLQKSHGLSVNMRFINSWLSSRNQWGRKEDCKEKRKLLPQIPNLNTNQTFYIMTGFSSTVSCFQPLGFLRIFHLSWLIHWKGFRDQNKPSQYIKQQTCSMTEL